MLPDERVKLVQAAIKGMERDKAEILPGAATILRLLVRLRPRMILRKKAAERMAAGG